MHSTTAHDCWLQLYVASVMHDASNPAQWHDREIWDSCRVTLERCDAPVHVSIELHTVHTVVGTPCSGVSLLTHAHRKVAAQPM